jgi:hypothetical protein
LCFEATSGLKINLQKSELVAVEEVPNIEELASILSCIISSFPMKYLGLPLGAPFKSRAIWNGVVERMEKRLASWKKIYLSKGGHLTLIKSTLSNLPTYFISLFPLPASIARRLKRFSEIFFGMAQARIPKYIWLIGRQFATWFPSGGLGIKKLMVFNKAFLGKWLWRFGHEEHSLWRQVIDSKYGHKRGGWCSEKARGSYGVSLWRYIRNGWGSFSNFLSYKVGDGSHISFWHNVWCGIEPLRLSFPELYSIA